MRPRRLPISQHEFPFAPEAFNLIQDTGIDGDRIARERRDADYARQLAEAAQAGLFAANRPNRNADRTPADTKTDTKRIKND